MDRSVLQRMVGTLRDNAVPSAAAFVVPADRYRDPERAARERALLARLPRVAAASSELAPGAYAPFTGSGRDAILARDHATATARAFANSCRHRGTRLVETPCTAAKAITCPYHAWTYDLAGALVHVPHEGTFAGLDRDARGLSPIAAHEADGLVWIGDGAAAHAAPIARDLAALDLANHVVFRRATATRRANWKLVIEAFLDGYHIRVLHRDSVYRYFVDGAIAAEPVGPHIRAVTARRAVREAPADPAAFAALSLADLRALGTPSYLVFPATILIEHPDFISLMTVHPEGPSACTWEHVMLVPAARAGEREHWERNWTLIEEGVFQREDLWICEQAQRAIDSGATTELLFGALEEPARWFHAALDAALARDTIRG